MDERLIIVMYMKFVRNCLINEKSAHKVGQMNGETNGKAEY